jgi:hypothetical protein
LQVEGILPKDPSPPLSLPCEEPGASNDPLSSYSTDDLLKVVSQRTAAGRTEVKRESSQLGAKRAKDENEDSLGGRRKKNRRAVEVIDLT